MTSGKFEEGWHWEILLPGVPAVSDRGYLGWCSVSLLTYREREKVHHGLFDTGNVGDRAELMASLKRRKIDCSKIDFIILSHLHYDHVLNLELFKASAIYVSKAEIDYFEAGAKNDIYYPNSYIRDVMKRFTAVKAMEKLYGGSFIELPGHTAGSIGFLVGRTLFAGDALKYAAEAKRRSISTAHYSLKQANRSLQKIFSLADTVIPGHDSPFMLTKDTFVYLDRREVHITLRGEGTGLSIKAIER